MIKNLSFVLFAALAFSSCKKDDFDAQNADFQLLYNNLIDEGKTEEFTMDLEVHEYTFTLSEDKTLFVIGYQSHADLRSTDYTIEIVDNTDSSIIYNQEHQFPERRISYVAPKTPVSFQSGVSYTVRRIQTNWGDNISTTIGTLIKTDEADYPISAGIMTITESDFRAVGENYNSHKFFAIPQIELIFE
jgi:hypothetical protein